MSLQTVTLSSATTSNQYTLKLELIENSTNTTNNTSSISWRLYLTSGNWSFSTYQVGWSISLNGNVVSSKSRANAPQISIGKNSSVNIVSGTSTITHNTDGTLNMPCIASIDMSQESYTPGAMSLNGSMTLTVISRASTLTVPSTMTMGTASTLTIARSNSSFTHTISYKVGSGSYTNIVSKTSSTSVSWTPPITLIDTFGATSGTVTLRLITYSGNTQIGDAKTYNTTVNAPSESTMSVPTFTAGTSSTLTIDRKNSSYTHTIQYKFGNVDWTTIVTKTSSTSVSWTPPTSLLQQFTTSTSKTETNGLRLTTYYGNTQIGVNYYDLTIKAGSSTKPTATLTISPNNNTQNATVRGWGYYIKGLSKINYSIAFEGYQESTVSAREFVALGSTYTNSSGTTGILNSSGTYTVKARVKDSRGVWSDYDSKSITIYNYAQPTISSVSAYRSDSSGVADSSGTYLRLYCSASRGASINNQNTITISYVVKQGSTIKASGTLTSGTATILSGYDTTKNYSVTITVTDSVGTSIVRIIGIPSEVVTLHLKEGGDGVAFGGYASIAKAVDFTAWSPIGMVLGLGRAKASIEQGADFNNLLEPGVYRVTDSSYTSTFSNCPSNYAGTLRVWSADGVVKTTSDTYHRVIQEYIDYLANIYIRSVRSGSTAGDYTYDSWKKVTTTTV